MSFWFLPEVLPRELLEKALVREELALPAEEGLPDLSRALSRDQIASWLAALMPDTLPEHIAVRAEHYWQLGHEVTTEDHIVLPTQQGMLIIGEITGVYRFETRDAKPCHIWPVAWLEVQIAEATLPELRLYLSRGNIVEIKNEELLARIIRHIPSQRRIAVTFFKWITIIILISELIYFWPR